MAGTYVQYPSSNGGGGGGSLSSISFSIGQLDAGTINQNGASVSSNSIFLQSFTQTFPGLVNSASQTFGGTKTFVNSPIFSSLTQGSVLFTGPGGLVSQDNADLFWNNTTKQLLVSQPDSVASALLPVIMATIDPLSSLGQGIGLSIAGSPAGIGIINRNDSNAFASSLLITGGADISNGSNIQFFGLNHASSPGNLTLMLGASGAFVQFLDNNSNPIFEMESDGTLFIHGYVSQGPFFTNSMAQLVSGSVSLTSQVRNNLPLSQTQGSLSLVNQVSGNLPLNQTSGSLSLTTQVSGNLPLSQTQGSVSFSQLQPYPQLTIGSVTQTSSTGGSAYTVKWPGTLGSGSSVLRNDGNGNLSFSPIRAPTVQKFSTVGSFTYTTPLNVSYIKVTMVGGGGGSGGFGTTGGGLGGTGGTANFLGSSSAYSRLICTGGSGGASGGSGGTGGNFIIGSATAQGFIGGCGGGGGVGLVNLSIPGSPGGSSIFGGGGLGTSNGSGSPGQGAPNTGGGGGGSGTQSSTIIVGGGSGAAGAALIAFIYSNNLAPFYSVSVPDGGVGGTAGGGGSGGPGAQGGSGLVFVEEYY